MFFLLWLFATAVAYAQVQDHSRSITIQRGQVLEFETLQALDSSTAKVGDAVRYVPNANLL